MHPVCEAPAVHGEMDVIHSVLHDLGYQSKYLKHTLSIQFPTIEKFDGICKIDAKNTAEEGLVTLSAPEKDTAYTMIISDPDAPTRANATLREFIHHVIINVRSSGSESLVLTDKGETVLPYLGAAPPYSSGYHRYVWLVFKQSKPIELEAAQRFFKGRVGRSSSAFTEENGLIGPIAVSVVMAQWDDSVDAIHVSMDWTPPVAFLSPAQKIRLASSNQSIATPPELPAPSVRPRPARLRFIIAPGNGGCGVSTKRCNFYGWLHTELEKRGHESICVNWPDPYVCHQTKWMAFARDKLKADENTVVVGHSTGALLAMRLLEQQKLFGAILVSAAHTDLGDAGERASGYFDSKWNWEAMKPNARFIHQFHSRDDHLIPLAEARYVAKKLNGDNFKYEELDGHGHFFNPFKELLDCVDSNCST